jgi:hypothetical protein
MAITRREFLRILGVALADLAIARCAPSVPEDHPSRTRLRACWQELARLCQDNQADIDEIDRKRGELVDKHRAVLDDLVASGELEGGVADLIQVAFSEAAFHIWRTKAPITCYVVYPIEASAREDILKQLEVLREVSDGLDPRVVRQVETAMAQDISLLDAVAGGEVQTDLIEQFKAQELQVGRDVLEASRFLVDLLAPEGP